MIKRLGGVKAPNLPIAPTAYSAAYQNQFSDVMRLYFNRIDAVLQAFFGLNGGQYVSFPHLEADSLTAQTATALTPQPITFGFRIGTGFLVDSNKIIAQQPGLYSVVTKLQIANSDTLNHRAEAWIKVNGVDVADSAVFIFCPASHGGADGHATTTTHYQVWVEPDDEIEVYWVTDNANVFLETSPAQTTPYVRPAIPSASVSVIFVTSQTL